MMLARAVGRERRFGFVGALRCWGFVVLLAASVTLVEARLVGASLAFTGRDAWVASAALGIAVAATWAGVVRACARTHAQLAPQSSAATPDSLAVFAGSVAGRGTRIAAWSVLVVLPFVAYWPGGGSRAIRLELSHAEAERAGRVAHRVLRCLRGRWRSACARIDIRRCWRRHLSRRSRSTAVSRHVEPGVVLERYAPVDPSFRLIRDARTMRSAETAEHYAFLHSQTLVPPPRVHPVDIDFVSPLKPAEGRKPHVFLLVVDSMRRDYVSAYNPAVTFTPEIGKLAADSFVFQRAFTRYSGTGCRCRRSGRAA